MIFGPGPGKSSDARKSVFWNIPPLPPTEVFL